MTRREPLSGVYKKWLVKWGWGKKAKRIHLMYGLREVARLLVIFDVPRGVKLRVVYLLKSSR